MYMYILALNGYIAYIFNHMRSIDAASVRKTNKRVTQCLINQWKSRNTLSDTNGTYHEGIYGVYVEFSNTILANIAPLPNSILWVIWNTILWNFLAHYCAVLEHNIVHFSKKTSTVEYPNSILRSIQAQYCGV